ncbi:glycosyltransferase involved in cell wall biosynthesis [Salinibacter ruber]|uniref:glycosyltransferase family 4 protein n=2 Tax=Salinibacter ruber TaxID=146919 RepID=UPI002167CE34|nr:glycosyltransferase family 4 protein [Salinibacter ruber]MCS4114600.1 glycosyltransferase involved in cell wall biosynthesis [Salinibacter ruber]MCS4181767.1 glycosyltransferase involved in cell wall biosynthesis [Salinibacter ruber]
MTIGTFSENAAMKRVKGLAPHLLAAGHGVTIVAKDTPENRKYFSAIDAEKVFFSGPGMLQEIRQKARVLMKRCPDVVYACGWGLRNGVTLMGNTSIVEHAEVLSSFPSAERKAVLRTKDYLMEWISIFVTDGLVLASDHLLKLYQNRDIFDSVKKLKLPYGVEGFNSAGKKDAVEKGVINIVYMGTLCASYGIFDIVDSVPHVVDADIPVEYVILGDGPEREEAVNRARALGIEEYIHFEGYVDEDVLEERLASADVFLAPMFDTVKDKARCPSKIPMYMRYRRPIVTCRIGEAGAYLGDYGFYYDPGQPESMARQVLKASRVQGPVDYDLQRISWRNLSERFLTWLGEDVLPDQKR